MFLIEQYEERVSVWAEFRDSLETSCDPFLDVIKFYNQATRKSLQYDPWDEKTWPTAWQLILENSYCSFSISLGMYYTLKLLKRFSKNTFELCIAKCYTDNIYYYLLQVDNNVLGYNDLVIEQEKLPSNLVTIKKTLLTL